VFFYGAAYQKSQSAVFMLPEKGVPKAAVGAVRFFTHLISSLTYLLIVVRCHLRRTHSFALLCSILQPSSIRRLATPWTYFLHLSPSSVILIDFSTDNKALLKVSTRRHKDRISKNYESTASRSELPPPGRTHTQTDGQTDDIMPPATSTP